LVALAPDVILAVGGSTVEPLLQVSRTVPIVFVSVVDPVGAGFVASLARPGRNATGFSQFEYGMSAKWLELLKHAASDPSCGHARSILNFRDRHARSNSSRGAIVGSGIESGRRARYR
jgi:hypothetical protein